MAKSLPYFKFYCSEWSDGDITLEDMKTQGLFINICSYYWSQECDISNEKLSKRFKNHKKQIENLKKAEIIFSENENIVIKFLDKQWSEREAVKHRNQQNGKAGGRPKITQSVKSGLAKTNPSETNIEERREEKIEIKEDIKSKPKNEWTVETDYPFDLFWEMYAKKVDKSKCEPKYNRIKESERGLIFEHVLKYIASTPDKKFRKDPSSYLNQKAWNNEIITNTSADSNKRSVDTSDESVRF